MWEKEEGPDGNVCVVGNVCWESGGNVWGAGATCVTGGGVHGAMRVTVGSRALCGTGG